MERAIILKYAKMSILGFAGLFLIQALYQGFKTGSEGPGQSNQGIFENSRKNYASYSKKGFEKVPEPVVQGKQSVPADKYEKIARLTSRSSSFDADRKQLSESLKAQKGVIQFESLQGLPGGQTYYLSAGIPPELFDSTVEELRRIGIPSGLSIEKTDKTSEYMALLERRASLERMRASLAALKGKGGSMDEFLKLENRLLEIEEQLRDTGLSIGQFNAENEFCTVQFTLKEVQGWTIRKLGHVAVDAFLWTLATFVMILFLAGSALAGVWVLLALRNRVRRQDLRPPGN